MRRFTLEKSKYSFGQITIYDLLIDDENQFDQFEAKFVNKYDSQLNSIKSYISLISDGRKLSTQ